MLKGKRNIAKISIIIILNDLKAKKNPTIISMIRKNVKKKMYIQFTNCEKRRRFGVVTSVKSPKASCLHYPAHLYMSIYILRPKGISNAGNQTKIK